MRKGSPIVRPVTVSIRIGEPVETAGLSVDERDAVIRRVRRKIEEMLADAPGNAARPPAASAKQA
jgi:hypothetical protein